MSIKRREDFGFFFSVVKLDLSFTTFVFSCHAMVALVDGETEFMALLCLEGFEL